MEKYPELIKSPECAEQFYNEYKGMMSDESLMAGFNFALNCDMFNYSFNRYLLNDKKSFYRLGQNIRSFFSENAEKPKRAALYAVFINEYLEVTRRLLLDREYYELMTRFEDAEDKVQNIMNLQMSEINRPT